MRILVWSMHPENVYAEHALRAGAQGYIHKGHPSGEILAALRMVVAGKVHVSGTMADQLMKRIVGTSHPSDCSPVDALSDRELETFELLGQGLTTEQIAAKMHVSPKTVETFRAHIKRKLNLDTLAELMQRAAQWALEKG